MTFSRSSKKQNTKFKKKNTFAFSGSPQSCITVGHILFSYNTSTVFETRFYNDRLGNNEKMNR